MKLQLTAEPSAGWTVPWQTFKGAAAGVDGRYKGDGYRGSDRGKRGAAASQRVGHGGEPARWNVE